jgi:hypothetical protein
MMRRVLCKNNGIVIVALNDVNRFVLDAALDSPAGVTIVGSNGIFNHRSGNTSGVKKTCRVLCVVARVVERHRSGLGSGAATPHTGTMR